MSQLELLRLAGIDYEISPTLTDAATWDGRKATIAASELDSLSLAATVQWLFDQALYDMLQEVTR